MDNKDYLIPAKKGEIRNPNGKPKGTLNRSTIAKKWLEVMESVKNPITGENQRLSQEDIITLAVIKKARAGDVNAYKELLNNGYGLPTQKLDIKQEKPIFNGINLDVANDNSTTENTEITQEN